MLETDAKNELLRRFDSLLASSKRGQALSETLITIEKLKYAVMVTASRSRQPLSADTIEQMAGPASGTARSIFDHVTSFLSPNNFAGFLNKNFRLGVPAGFTNVSSLNDLDGMLIEPWFGTGPVSSANGKGFDRLRGKIKSFKHRFEAMKNYDRLAANLVDDIEAKNPEIIGKLGGHDKAKALMVKALRTRNYEARINRTEEYLSQVLANRVTAAHVLRHGTGGRNMFEAGGGQRISDNEQFNLERDFDRLYNEIVGNLEQWTPGMWHKVEDFKVMYEKVDRDDLGRPALDMSKPADREKAVAHALDIASLFSLRLMPRPQIAGTEQQILQRDTLKLFRDMAAGMVEEIKAAGLSKADVQKAEVFLEKLNEPSTLNFDDGLKGFLNEANKFLGITLEWNNAKAIAIRNDFKPKLETIKDVLILLEVEVPELTDEPASSQQGAPALPPSVNASSRTGAPRIQNQGAPNIQRQGAPPIQFQPAPRQRGAPPLQDDQPPPPSDGVPPLPSDGTPPLPRDIPPLPADRQFPTLTQRQTGNLVAQLQTDADNENLPLGIHFRVSPTRASTVEYTQNEDFLAPDRIGASPAGKIRRFTVREIYSHLHNRKWIDLPPSRRRATDPLDIPL